MKLPSPDYQQYRRYYQMIKEVGKKPKTHLYSTIAFTFLTVSLFAWYAIRPTIQTILHLRREIADKTEVNKKMEDKISGLINAQATLSEIDANIPLLSQAVPPNPEAVSLLNQINSLAQITQASVSSAGISDVSVLGDQASKAGEISLSINISGAYEQIKQFLDGIIDMRRIATIDSISIVPNLVGSVDAAGPLQLIVNVRGYYQTEETNGKRP